MEVREMVRAGYKSLAERTTVQFRKVRKCITSRDSILLERLGACENDLKAVSRDGDVRVLGLQGGCRLQDIISSLDGLVLIRPFDCVMAVKIAVSAIMNHTRIPSESEVIKRGKIDYVNLDVPTAYILLARQSDGSLCRTFGAKCDISRPLLSVIENVHELLHSLKFTQDRVIRIMSHVLSVTNYQVFITAVHNDARLREMRFTIARKTHELDFFSMPEILATAESAGVDMSAFRLHLAHTIPLLDFLLCMDEGEVYVSQSGVAAKAGDFKSIPLLQDFCRLIGLLDALSAPFSDIKGRYYEVGIGLYEYFRVNPRIASRLMYSEDFPHEVSAYIRSVPPIAEVSALPLAHGSEPILSGQPLIANP